MASGLLSWWAGRRRLGFRRTALRQGRQERLSMLPQDLERLLQSLPGWPARCLKGLLQRLLLAIEACYQIPAEGAPG